jgi:hypothetical protein
VNFVYLDGKKDAQTAVNCELAQSSRALNGGYGHDCLSILTIIQIHPWHLEGPGITFLVWEGIGNQKISDRGAAAGSPQLDDIILMLLRAGWSACLPRHRRFRS